MKELKQALSIFILLSVLTGLLYPVILTATGAIFFPKEVTGSLLTVDGSMKGSALIAQKFESPTYFLPRPSAIDFNPMSSGGSNLGPTSLELKKLIEVRKQKWVEVNPNEKGEVPTEFLFASASGLDPHITPQGAMAQVNRIAKARGLSPEKIKQLVHKFTEGPQFGFLGETRVNVVSLNFSLDQVRSEKP